MEGVFGGSSWLWIILVGFVVGVLARLIKPGKQDIGIILTVVLGIVGALFAGWVGRLLGWYAEGEKVGFLASLAGAIVLLFIAELVNGKRGRRRG
jgi:uncharacterized membrane protein YeaQ/YmgE (transglycosylase-associated protein family)